jgi:plastocyanin
MRFLGQALLASMFVLGACAGSEKKAAAADTTSGTAAATPAATPAAAPAAPADSASKTTAASSSQVTPAPITGKTWEVKMIGDQQGYRFDPAHLTIKEGDGVKFVMVSGGPHNVAFDSTAIPAGATAQLKANMPNQMAPLQSNFMMNDGESYTVSFGKLPKGVYNFHCVPHVSLGMKGTITVQ